MCGCECNKASKIDEYLNTKNCSCKKYLIGKLVLQCENEMLDTTETSLDHKKVICKKILFTRFYGQLRVCCYCVVFTFIIKNIN